MAIYFYLAHFFVPELTTATAPKINTVALNSGQPGASPRITIPEITPTNGVISDESEETLTGTKLTRRTQAQ